MLRCFVRDHITTWGQVMPMAEFVYNNSINRSTGMSPFQAVTRVRSCLPADLAPLLEESRPSGEVEEFI